MRRSLFCAVVMALSCAFAAAQQYNVLYNFDGPPSDGSDAMGNLIFDGAGNLYGVTQAGGSGTGSQGTIFELSPGSNGVWTESVLYNFCSDYVNQQCLDGSLPRGGLALDPENNLYGTTYEGGGNNVGLVFELSPPSAQGGAWTYSVLHDFCSNFVNNQCLDGAYPNGDLILDASGNLFGTAGGGNGHGDQGLVWEFSPNAGQWTETILYNFCSLGQGLYCPDGSTPTAGVIFDEFGNLFGTTGLGGMGGRGYGVLYELSPNSGGWAETVLYEFGVAIGTGDGVAVDPLGNLYTPLSAGKKDVDGGILKWSPNGKIAGFQFNGADGVYPVGGLLLDLKRPALYGTTDSNVFEITPPAEETVLYTFCSQPGCTDGSSPGGGVIEDKFGNLYGTTRGGGANGGIHGGYGVVYEITK